jgi:hypothetical protein
VETPHAVNGSLAAHHRKTFADRDSAPLAALLASRFARAGQDPDHWRFRAEETRTVADQMTDEAARTIMRRVANDYDRLALHHAHPDGFGLGKNHL